MEFNRRIESTHRATGAGRSSNSCTTSMWSSRLASSSYSYRVMKRTLWRSHVFCSVLSPSCRISVPARHGAVAALVDPEVFASNRGPSNSDPYAGAQANEEELASLLSRSVTSMRGSSRTSR